ncbi:zinc finger, C3HC4 type (RING finger) domain-containing protein [Besnoitia besnoiti]|uniref:Zinc finger, C3HC4 type (RING finger) domain-containing protein n=1 Tax=Besnoitia besnoiti TaxID=94643 RepID=A0A2A9M4N1_BESBE|nr:zinc finger, C3HC4 type (RING finger) domain-containing protein [Besnoitia besnoiti]PFH32909.1 zinc finger, C3HC4 type (RING finger) domain-containing protein [Besnoitia besnoiti]
MSAPEQDLEDLLAAVEALHEETPAVASPQLGSPQASAAGSAPACPSSVSRSAGGDLRADDGRLARRDGSAPGDGEGPRDAPRSVQPSAAPGAAVAVAAVPGGQGEESLRRGEQRVVNDPFELDASLGDFFDEALPATGLETWADFLSRRTRDGDHAAVAVAAAPSSRPPPASVSAPSGSARAARLSPLARGPPISPPPLRRAPLLVSQAAPLFLPAGASSAAPGAWAPTPPRRRDTEHCAERGGHADTQGARPAAENGPHAALSPSRGSPQLPRRRPLSLEDYFSSREQTRRRRADGSAEAGGGEGHPQFAARGRAEAETSPLTPRAPPVAASRPRTPLAAASTGGASSSSGAPQLLLRETEGARRAELPLGGDAADSPLQASVAASVSPLAASALARPPPSSKSSSPHPPLPRAPLQLPPRLSQASPLSPPRSPSASAARLPPSGAPPLRTAPPSPGAATLARREAARGTAPSPKKEPLVSEQEGRTALSARLVGVAFRVFEREEECSVCLTELETVNEVATVDDCRHSFCLGCISRWVRQSRSCPLCRGPTTTVSLWKARGRAAARPNGRATKARGKPRGEGEDGEAWSGGRRRFAYSRRLQPDDNNILKPVGLASKQASGTSRGGRGSRQGASRRAKAAPMSRPALRAPPVAPAPSSPPVSSVSGAAVTAAGRAGDAVGGSAAPGAAPWDRGLAQAATRGVGAEARAQEA